MHSHLFTKCDSAFSRYFENVFYNEASLVIMYLLKGLAGSDPRIRQLML